MKRFCPGLVLAFRKITVFFQEEGIGVGVGAGALKIEFYFFKLSKLVFEAMLKATAAFAGTVILAVPSSLTVIVVPVHFPLEREPPY